MLERFVVQWSANARSVASGIVLMTSGPMSSAVGQSRDSVRANPGPTQAQPRPNPRPIPDLPRSTLPLDVTVRGSRAPGVETRASFAPTPRPEGSRARTVQPGQTASAPRRGHGAPPRAQSQTRQPPPTRPAARYKRRYMAHSRQVRRSLDNATPPSSRQTTPRRRPPHESAVRLPSRRLGPARAPTRSVLSTLPAEAHHSPTRQRPAGALRSGTDMPRPPLPPRRTRRG